MNTMGFMTTIKHHIFGMSVDELRERAATLRPFYEHGGPNLHPDKLPIDDLLSLTLDLPHRRIGELGRYGHGSNPEANWHNLEKFLGEHGVKIGTFKSWDPKAEKWHDEVVAYKDEKDFIRFKQLLKREVDVYVGQTQREIGEMFYTKAKVDEYMSDVFKGVDITEKANFTKPLEHATTGSGKLEELSKSFNRELAQHPKTAFAIGGTIASLGAVFIYKSTKNLLATDDEKNNHPKTMATLPNIITVAGGACDIWLGNKILSRALKGHYMQFER